MCIAINWLSYERIEAQLRHNFLASRRIVWKMWRHSIDEFVRCWRVWACVSASTPVHFEFNHRGGPPARGRTTTMANFFDGLDLYI